MSSAAVVVLITAPTAAVARRLANVLVAERLAACVNIVGGVRSVYRWGGKVEKAAEHLLLAKTTRARFPAFVRRVKALHPYEVPEIVALPIHDGHPSYLSWLSNSVKTLGGSR